jgi:hypothetical protein
MLSMKETADIIIEVRFKSGLNLVWLPSLVVEKADDDPLIL